MIIQKVITGFVVQQFDTETRRFISQEFIGSDDRQWERRNGEALTNSNEDLALIYGEGGVDEPHLNTEMVQPKGSGVIMDATPLLATARSFELGEHVLVTPSDNPDDLVNNEFMGVVVGFRDNTLVSVKDQDDKVFDVDPIQCHHVM